MNRSEIEWVDFNWNPLSGCKESCQICIGRKKVIKFIGDKRWNLKNSNFRTIGDIRVLDERVISSVGGPLNYPFGFDPTYHRYRLDTPARWKRSRRILVCGYGELFGPWVPTEIIEEIFEACKKYPKHFFLFLTRFPDRYMELDQSGKLPQRTNFWYGYSLPLIEGTPFENNRFNTFTVMDPLSADDRVPDTDWLILGPKTGDASIPQTELLDVSRILKEADQKCIPVYMSKFENSDKSDLRKEYPEGLQKVQPGDGHLQKNYSTCSECRELRKNDSMANFLVKSRRGEAAKKLLCMCEDCFRKFCSDRDIEVPELDGFKKGEKNG